MSGRVEPWQPIAESVAVVVLIASGQMALFSSLPNPGLFDHAVMYRAGALTDATWMAEPWRLLAATWLHADVSHLVGNLVFLLLMSVLLTRALGWDRFLLLYLGSGLAGSVLSALIEHPNLEIGASGAIFGLTGATVAYSVNPRAVLHETEVLAVREALLPIVGMQLLFSFAPGVSWGAHLGGFAFGMAAAFSGLADLGLEQRTSGLRLPGVRWGWVVLSTVGVVSISLCAGWMTIGLLALYVGGLVLSGRTGPDFRPHLYPSVIAVALVALGVNAAAVGLSLWRGEPWSLDTEGVPRAGRVSLPGGLGSVQLPDVLIAARVDADDGVRFGEPEAFPFALQLEVAPLEAPLAVVQRMLDVPFDGRPRRMDAAQWSADCPWVAWTTGRSAGIVVFTAVGVVDVQLLRMTEPASPGWRTAENVLVEHLYALKDCEPAPWSPGELGQALARAGLSTEAIAALGRQINETPDDPAPRFTRARLYLEHQACAAALLDYQVLADASPDAPDAWAGLSRATLECGSSTKRPAEAESLAARALSLDPRHVVGLEARADAQIALGQREQAAMNLRAAAAASAAPEERIRLENRAEKAERGFIVRDRMGN